MAYDTVRAQLDKLLGPDRNGPLTDSRAKAPLHYSDDSICKNYLLGFCPNDLHIKHRSEPGSCRLTHSESAKADFQNDIQQGHASRDKLRWTRALLKESRLILSEEDRKIRGHARRLQVSYNASGSLAGLMIRDFDTLKKLGMVSEHAQVKVQNEDSDDDVATAPSVSTYLSSDLKRVDAPTPKTSQTANLIEDDIDGFGIVDVTPADSAAADNSVDEFGRISKNSPQKEVKEVKDTNQNTDKQDSEDNDFSDFEIHSSGSDTADRRKVQSTGDSENNPDHPLRTTSSNLNPVHNDTPADKSQGKHRDAPDSKLKQKPVAQSEISTSRPVKEAAKAKSPEKETDLNVEKSGPKLTPEQIMNKFYETGEGPDGLMMLDRKQSLRVCACCGGFISLVDAESRLLSHYGGKSHHSLAVLRVKIIEIEKTLSDLTARQNDDDAMSNNPTGPNSGTNRNQAPWPRPADRSPGWTRRDREPYQQARRRGNDRSIRANDVNPNNNSDRSYHDYGHYRDAPDRRRDSYDRDSSYGSRRDDYSRGPARHSGGRKRNRSPPPYQSNRRSRRY